MVVLLNAIIRYGRKGEVTGLSLRYDVLLCGGVVVVVVVVVIFDVDRRSVSCDAHAIVWCFAHFYIFRFVQNDILQFSKAKRRLATSCCCAFVRLPGRHKTVDGSSMLAHGDTEST